MQFSKRITSLFLSFTLIACCLTFQADGISNIRTTSSSWVNYRILHSSNQNAYQINLKKAHGLFENNFSIFNFKCCLKHHDMLCDVEYKKGTYLHLPLQLKFLKILHKQSNLKADTFIG